MKRVAKMEQQRAVSEGRVPLRSGIVIAPAQIAAASLATEGVAQTPGDQTVPSEERAAIVREWIVRGDRFSYRQSYDDVELIVLGRLAEGELVGEMEAQRDGEKLGVASFNLRRAVFDESPQKTLDSGNLRC